MSEIKLLADGMLGSLAKWLRILGYDTLYFSHADDNELVRIARAEGRVLLTRDGELARRRGINALLIESEELREQVQQVVTELGTAGEEPLSRCPLCNAPLRKVEKRAVRGRVPPYVFRTHERFSVCPHCGRIYWRGTHWARMRQEIAHLIGGKELK
ncbi:MAG: Mut7-C RNAse domain-containing protein [Chloroflexota bacterium]|nr:Mut7-C RNAse domain-containing protein [Chloroflexota bacterium]